MTMIIEVHTPVEYRGVHQELMLHDFLENPNFFDVSLRCPCGGVILADTEDWTNPRCYECWREMGSPEKDPEALPDIDPEANEEKTELKPENDM